MHTEHSGNLRRGSLSLEVILALPVALMLMIAASYIMENMIFRHEVGAVSRTAAGRAAADLSCTGPGAVLEERSTMTRTATVSCQTIDDEGGLRSERPFWVSINQVSASHWSGFWRDIDPGRPVPSIVAVADASTIARQSAWAAQAFGATGTTQQHRRVHGQRWSHFRAPYRAGMDRQIWSRLSQAGTQSLFPNVFPARND
ncbi:MAG: hypothetical protein ABJM18_06930 [Hyphomonas sp.]|uniref:hypothetical protein n=1 Tax=Hyphomonas sp. TaxID=87 RepID=UPI003296CE0A